MGKLLLTKKRQFLLSRRSFMAAPAIILANRALAQVGQITGWPPNQFISGSSNPFLLVAHTAKLSTDGGATPITTNPIATNAGSVNLIIVGFTYYGASTITIADNQSNTYTALTRFGLGSAQASCLISYCFNPVTSASHTFSMSAAAGGTFPALWVAAFSGALASPFDVQNGGGSSGTITSFQPGSITPSGNNELIITMFSTGETSAAPTIDSGFVITDALASVGSQALGGGLAYLKQVAAAAINPTWSFPSNNLNAAAIAAFI